MDSNNYPTDLHDTTGNIPAKRIGASVTIIGSKAYLFGGSLAAEQPTGEAQSSALLHPVVASLFVCDLERFAWKELEHSPDFTPPARCFHSANAWNEQLVIFGGSGTYQNPGGGCQPFNDVQIFNTAHSRWLPPSEFNGGSNYSGSTPIARYSHLSSVIEDRLLVLGGVGIHENALQDIHVYDLQQNTWVQVYHYPRHLHQSFDAVACADQHVHVASEPSQGPRTASGYGNSPSLSSIVLSNTSISLSPKISSSSYSLPYCTPCTDDFSCLMHVYSHNKLETFSWLPSPELTVHDKSLNLGHGPSPPPLRFLVGAIIGTHLIISGNSVSEVVEIWMLDLLTLTWSTVDPGRDVADGSWLQGCSWRDSNKFVMFGNGSVDANDNRSVDANDYGERSTSWDSVAVIDLESFGIYQPPAPEYTRSTQDLLLDALENATEVNFKVICEDDREIECSRNRLESGWPWFKSQHEQKRRLALMTPPASARSSRQYNGGSTSLQGQLDPRIKSGSLDLAEPYEVVRALLQYFYTLSLSSGQTPFVLCRLLVLSTTYKISRLESLVKHAMHRDLSEETCDIFCQAAMDCGCQSLQFRCMAFKTLQTSASPYIQSPRNGRTLPLPHSQSNRNRTPTPASNQGTDGLMSLIASKISLVGRSSPRPSAPALQNEGESTLQPASPTTTEQTSRRVSGRHHFSTKPQEPKNTKGGEKARNVFGPRHHFIDRS